VQNAFMHFLPVILSEAKDLMAVATASRLQRHEVLRCAQDDREEVQLNTPERSEGFMLVRHKSLAAFGMTPGGPE